jgi:predicted nucleic acid-binding protein
MTLVVDASVVVKWLLTDPAREAEVAQAERLMAWVLKGQEEVLQPAHWLIEVGAVLARLSPATAVDDVAMLRALELPTDDGPSVLERACRLAIDLRQHLFDTLYHAVALETPDTRLVTADARYLAAGASLGRIIPLSEWASTPTG